MTKKLVTILIPSHEYPDHIKHLTSLLFSIMSQETDLEIKVLISCHSKNKDVYDSLCKVCIQINLDISVFWNNKNVGNWQDNINFLLDKVEENSVVKIMFSDDIFVRLDSLQTIVNSLQNNDWLVLGCTHFHDVDLPVLELARREKVSLTPDFIPKWDERMPIELINFIGAPSVIAIARPPKSRFDRSLHLGGDVDFYYQLKMELGVPSVVSDCHIAIRRHARSITTLLESRSIGRLPSGRRVRTRKDLHVMEVHRMSKKYGFPKIKNEPAIYLWLETLVRSLIRRVKGFRF